MKINITEKNYEREPGITERIEKKLGVLERYGIISPSDEAHVLLRGYPDGKKMEVTIYTKYGLLRTEARDHEMINALDKVVDKLQDQIRRVKTRMNNRKSSHPLYEALSVMDLAPIEEEDDEIVRTKSIHPEEMSLEEAIINMNLLDHSFYIYKDDETNQIAVVYRRHDGGYGLIETE